MSAIVEVKLGTNSKAPVIFRDDDAYHQTKPGIAYSAVTFKYRRADISSLTTKALGSGDWDEAGDGHYDALLSTVQLSTLGVYFYIAQASDCVQYEGALEVVLKTRSEIAAELTTLSAMIATLDDEIGTIKTKTDNLPVNTGQELTDIDVALSSVPQAVEDLQATIHGLSSWETGVAADLSTLYQMLATIDFVVDGIRTKTDNLPANTRTELDAIDAALVTITGDVALVMKIETGRWKIDTSTKQMTFYDTDGVTPLRTYDLKDAVGAASVTEIMERVPV